MSRRPAALLGALAWAALATAAAPATSLPVTQDEIRVLADEIASTHLVPPPTSIATTALPPAKIKERVRELIMQDYDAEGLVDEGRLMVRMGLLSPGTCYEEVVYALLEEQVVGLYDPRHEELLLVTGSSPATMQEVLVHELTHAVQDSAFGIGARLERKPGEMDLRAGLQAVSEGDALLMEQILSGVLVPASITPEQIRALMDLVSIEDDPFVKAPPFIREALLFPYVYGLVLVRRAHADGGYAAVNDLLAHPPASTEQVLHPAKLHVDDPLHVPLGLPADLSDLYRNAGEDVMGEFQLRTWLAQWIDAPAAERAAAGWGGDRYLFLWPRSQDVGPEHLHHGVLVLVVELDPGPAGDPDAEAVELFDALVTYIETRFAGATLDHGPGPSIAELGEGQRAIVERRGRKVLYVEGLPDADPPATEAVLDALWSSTGG